MYGYEIFYGKALFMDNGDMTFTTKRKAYTDALATVLDCINNDELPDPMNNELEIYIYQIKEECV